MEDHKTPAPQRAGTATESREAREMEVVRKLEDLAESNPPAFDDLLKLLARLVVESERERD